MKFSEHIIGFAWIIDVRKLTSDVRESANRFANTLSASMVFRLFLFKEMKQHVLHINSIAEVVHSDGDRMTGFSLRSFKAGRIYEDAQTYHNYILYYCFYITNGHQTFCYIEAIITKHFFGCTPTDLIKKSTEKK